MRSFLLLAFMTPAVIFGLDNPTLFYEIKFYEKTQAYQNERRNTYTAADQKKAMDYIAKIAEDFNAAAVIPYYPQQTWVNPKFEITDWLVNLLDTEYRKEKTCS